jgi:hypothetical protein
LSEADALQHERVETAIALVVEDFIVRWGFDD